MKIPFLTGFVFIAAAVLIQADETAIPPATLRPSRNNITLEDQMTDQLSHEEEDWVYSENIIFCRDTFFCCDHAQSEPHENQLTWEDEQSKRWQMRKEIFPTLSDDAIILGNFNQLYKVCLPNSLVTNIYPHIYVDRTYNIPNLVAHFG